MHYELVQQQRQLIMGRKNATAWCRRLRRRRVVVFLRKREKTITTLVLMQISLLRVVGGVGPTWDPRFPCTPTGPCRAALTLSSSGSLPPFRVRLPAFHRPVTSFNY